MTIFPARSFSRIGRADFEGTIRALEQQRDDALERARATVEYALRWLEQRAQSFEQDARHLERAVKPDARLPAARFTAAQYRAMADELRQCGLDLERRDFDASGEGTP